DTGQGNRQVDRKKDREDRHEDGAQSKAREERQQRRAEGGQADHDEFGHDDVVARRYAFRCLGLLWLSHPTSLSSRPMSSHSTFSIKGLSHSEVLESRARHGRNELGKARHPWFDVFRDIITEPMVILLLAAAVIYLLSGEVADALFMVSAIIIDRKSVV